MKTKIFAVLLTLSLLTCVGVVASKQIGSSIPEPYLGQLKSLLVERVDITKKITTIDSQIEDLRQQKSLLCAKKDYNSAQEERLAQEILKASNKPIEKFWVDADSLSFKPRKNFPELANWSIQCNGTCGVPVLSLDADQDSFGYRY